MIYGACDHLDNAGFARLARLALAALDQAGVSLKGQARVADALVAEGVLTPEERAATGL